MTHEDGVFAALGYRRNVGATQNDIRKYLRLRENPKRTASDDLRALKAFEEQGLITKVVDRWFLTPKGCKLAKGPALRAEWQQSDAWIFAAVLYNRDSGDCRLHHIIATSDFINHAIPTLAEMHGAINRLMSARLIKVRNGHGFVPTASALDLLAKAEASCKGRDFDFVDCLRKLLECPCCGVRIKVVHWRFQLDQMAMTQAYDDYVATIRRSKKYPNGG